jgi:hypothetical protein
VDRAVVEVAEAEAAGSSRNIMGFLLVEYPTDRQVFIDDVQCGLTNDPFQVSNGSHRITLGTYQNYAPSFRRVEVRGEPYQAPKTTSFEPQ